MFPGTTHKNTVRERERACEAERGLLLQHMTFMGNAGSRHALYRTVLYHLLEKPSVNAPSQNNV